jgi:hypothetical protein
MCLGRRIFRPSGTGTYFPLSRGLRPGLNYFAAPRLR